MFLSFSTRLLSVSARFRSCYWIELWNQFQITFMFFLLFLYALGGNTEVIKYCTFSLWRYIRWALPINAARPPITNLITRLFNAISKNLLCNWFNYVSLQPCLFRTNPCSNRLFNPIKSIIHHSSATGPGCPISDTIHLFPIFLFTYGIQKTYRSITFGLSCWEWRMHSSALGRRQPWNLPTLDLSGNLAKILNDAVFFYIPVSWDVWSEAEAYCRNDWFRFHCTVLVAVKVKALIIFGYC